MKNSSWFVSLGLMTVLFQATWGWTQTLSLDFGPQPTQDNWNVITSYQGGTRLAGLIDRQGNMTGVTYECLNGFGGATQSGESSSLYPDSAVTDAFYVSKTDTALIKLKGLDANETYSLVFMGSRANVSNTRILSVTINNQSRVLDTANNTDQTISFNGVSPDSNGEIAVDLRTASNSQSSYSYLSLIEITGTFPKWKYADGIFVALDGDDLNDGTFTAPLATLAAARDLIRQIKQTQGIPAGGLTVWLRGGRYQMNDTLQLTNADSGTEEAPIVYSAFPGEQVIITGGYSIDSRLFQPVTDPVLVSRLNPAAVNQILVADLSQTPGTQEFAGKGSYGMLSWGKYLLQLAQWPNRGFNHIQTILDRGCTTRWTPKDQWPPYDESNPIGGEFTMRESFDWPAWQAELERTGDIQAQGHYSNDWYYEHNAVNSVTDGKVKLTWCTRYGVEDQMEIPRRVKFVNILYELDQMGEWYYDKTDRKLYLWPIGDIQDRPSITILGGNEFVHITDASYIRLERLTFENGGNLAIRVERGRGVVIAGCTIRNGIGMGIRVTDGYDHGIQSCDFYGLNQAFVLNGGNNRTLEPSGHYACNNHIYNCRLTGYGAVSVSGVGIRFANNLIHDMNGSLRYNGNELDIEYNEFYNMGYQMGDWNCAYNGANWYTFGSRIRYNFVHHLMETPQAYPVGAFRNDDDGMGNEFIGNIFYKTGRYAIAAAGPGNIIKSNIAMDTAYLWASWLGALTEAEIQEKWDELLRYEPGGDLAALRGDKGDFLYRLEQVIGVEGWNHEPYLSTYPRLKLIMDSGNPWASTYSVIRNNYVSNTTPIDIHYGGSGNYSDLIQYLPPSCDGEDMQTIDPDQAFVDVDSLNFQFKDSFTPMAGFETIDFNRIGLYIDAYRTQMPDKTAYRSAIREKYAGVRSSGGSYNPDTINLRYPEPEYLTHPPEVTLPNPLLLADSSADWQSDWTQPDGPWQYGHYQNPQDYTSFVPDDTRSSAPDWTGGAAEVWSQGGDYPLIGRFSASGRGRAVRRWTSDLQSWITLLYDTSALTSAGATVTINQNGQLLKQINFPPESNATQAHRAGRLYIQVNPGDVIDWITETDESTTGPQIMTLIDAAQGNGSFDDDSIVEDIAGTRTWSTKVENSKYYIAANPSGAGYFNGWTLKRWGSYAGGNDTIGFITYGHPTALDGQAPDFVAFVNSGGITVQSDPVDTPLTAGDILGLTFKVSTSAPDSFESFAQLIFNPDQPSETTQDLPITPTLIPADSGGYIANCSAQITLDDSFSQVAVRIGVYNTPRSGGSSIDDVTLTLTTAGTEPPAGWVGGTLKIFKGASPALAPGMVGYWSMDEAPDMPAGQGQTWRNRSLKVGDASGLDHHGTLYNTDSTCWTAGRYNNAVQLDGNNDYALIEPSDIADGAEELTVAGWIKPITKGDWKGILTSTCPTDSYFGLIISGYGQGHPIEFRAMNANLLGPDNSCPVGRWTHVAGVWKSGVMQKLYLNGIQVAQSDNPPVGIIDVDQWVIGSDRLNPNRYYSGKIDELALWTRALDAIEIRDLFLNGRRGLTIAQPSFRGDLQLNGTLDLNDFNIMSQNWLANECNIDNDFCDFCDRTLDGTVDVDDFKEMLNWQ